MRQKLPLSHGYELVVNDIGRTISPGETFDAPLLVPGCVPVEDSADEDESGEDSPAEPSAPDDPQAAVDAAEDASAPQGEPDDKTRAKGTRR